MHKLIQIEDLCHDSADRYLSPEQLQPDPQLAAEGWQRRFSAGADRVSEVTELYAELGFEVRAEPIALAEDGVRCDDCHSATAARFKTIYTRKKTS